VPRGSFANLFANFSPVVSGGLQDRTNTHSTQAELQSDAAKGGKKNHYGLTDGGPASR